MTKKWSKVLLKALVVFFAAFGTGFAISMYYAAGLGSDPYSMFVEALAGLAGTSVGTMSLCCNVVIVLWALVFARKYIGLGTFIQAVSVGVGIDTGARLWAYTGTGNLAVKLGFCFAAAVLVGAFIALYLACDMGCAPIDMLVLKVSATCKLRYQFAFYATYAVLFAIGVVLGGIWGVGTVIAPAGHRLGGRRVAAQAEGAAAPPALRQRPGKGKKKSIPALYFKGPGCFLYAILVCRTQNKGRGCRHG